jgi:hypothetical protein
MRSYITKVNYINYEDKDIYKYDVFTFVATYFAIYTMKEKKIK